MNLLLLRDDELLQTSIYKIKERKKNHLLSIKKVTIGSILSSARINLDLGDFKILEIRDDSIIGEYCPKETISKKNPSIELFISYQRPQTMKKIFQIIGTMEILKVNIFPLEKSEKSYESSSIWKNNSWKEEIELGMEQGKNIFYPEVLFFKNKYELRGKIQPKISLLLDPNGIQMKEAYTNLLLTNSIQLIIGPEGGLNENDTSFFLDLGAIKTKISNSILRTEQALTFVMGQIEILKENI
jgi:16S rRNA (uracil1498-N3)-methyltransferase